MAKPFRLNLLVLARFQNWVVVKVAVGECFRQPILIAEFLNLVAVVNVVGQG